MTHTREMLETSPRGADFDVNDLAAAIEACADANQAATACADASLAEPDVAELRTCIGLDLDCADVCAATVRVLSRQSRYDVLLVQRLLQACVRACASSAEECERHAAHHRHCAVCAEACGACRRACERLLDAEAFEQVQALAGG